MDMKSLIDYGTSLTFYLGIIFIVVATLIYVRKRINDLDAKSNSMFDIISTMAREIQYMKTVMSGGEGGGHPQGMNLESALNTDDNTKDVLMSHFQAGVPGDESSDDESSDDESGDDESGDDESGDDESGDDESEDEPVIETIENIKFNTTSTINDIDEDEEGQDEDNEVQDEDDEGEDEDDEGEDKDDEDDEVQPENNEVQPENNENEENVKLIDFNESSIIDSELNDVDLTDYNTKTTKELKELVSTKCLATEVNRLKRPQLIKLLQK